MLSEEQKHVFETVGYVRLPEAVDRTLVRDMFEGTWRILGQRGWTRDRPDTWQGATEYEGIRVAPNTRQLRAGTETPDDSPVVRQALDSVFGGAPRSPVKDWGQALLTLPNPGAEWLLPSKSWHFDHLCIEVQ